MMYQRISEFLHILGYQRGAPEQLSGKGLVSWRNLKQRSFCAAGAPLISSFSRA